VTVIYADVDGQPVPLDECGWLERRPCGCIVSAVVAVVEGHYTLATAEQAGQHLRRTKRDRDKAAREGLTLELITMAHYRENIGANWECAQHPREARDDRP
jgi:tRNA U38,U39,U40 pseudouridine synthase TruA